MCRAGSVLTVRPYTGSNYCSEKWQHLTQRLFYILINRLGHRTPLRHSLLLTSPHGSIFEMEMLIVLGFPVFFMTPLSSLESVLQLPE